MHTLKQMFVFHLNVDVQLVLEGIPQEDTLGIRKTKPKFPAFQRLFCFHGMTLTIASQRMVCL